MNSLSYQYHDGGRSAAGFKGETGDCVIRAICIVTEYPYLEIYNQVKSFSRFERTGRKKKGVSSARRGVYKYTINRLMDQLGLVWTPTMSIGSGCMVHLRPGEIPMRGRLIVSLSRHVCAVIDGVIYDNHDPSRNGNRCVYGYWTIKQPDKLRGGLIQ